MLMYLEASDPDYIDRINDGPYLPKKIVPQTATEPEHFIIKEKSEWSPEDKIEALKDVKVKTILHNSMDHVMSNRVIACRTVKGNLGCTGNSMSRHKGDQEEQKSNTDSRI